MAGAGPTTLTKKWYVDGTQSDVGTVTYAVTNGAGTVIASGTATKNGTGVTTNYTFSLPIVADPTVLRVRWTRSDSGAYLDDLLEVFGSVLFTEAEARAKQISGLQTPLSSETSYSDDTIATWRLKIQEAFEQRTGRSWVRRYCRLELSGNGGYQLGLHDGYARTSLGLEAAGPGRYRDIRRILTATVGGTAVTVGNIKILGSQLHRTDSTWAVATTTDPLNVVVEYEYGIDPTWEAHENGLRMILANAIPNDISTFAVSLSNEDGSQSFQRDGGFAWPTKVWEWLKVADMRVAIA